MNVEVRLLPFSPNKLNVALNYLISRKYILSSYLMSLHTAGSLGSHFFFFLVNILKPTCLTCFQQGIDIKCKGVLD